MWPDIYLKLLLPICSSLFLTTSYAQEPTLRQALGDAVNTVENHTLAEAARLKLVSVAESRRYALKTDDRISGYPIIGKLVSLDKEKSQQLTKLLLDKNNYAYGVLRRCKNYSLHGIRFTLGKQKVEVALGTPCNQTIITFKDKQITKWWGEVLGDKATKKVLMLLSE